MKVVHVVRQFYPSIGGLEKFVFSLAKHQVRAGIDVSVLTLNTDFRTKKTLPEEDYINDVRIIRIPFFGSKRYPIAISAIKHIRYFDIIHIHAVDFFVDYLSISKFWHKKKIVLHTHGGFFHTRWAILFKKLYFFAITKLMLKNCDKIIACSQSDAILFKKISNNVVFINNGVEVERYLRIEKNIEKGTLLFVGRVDAHKKIDNLIYVLKALIVDGYDVVLKIIGPDWNGTKAKLINLIRTLNLSKYVLFFDSVSDEELLNELKKANIFVSASEYEGFGISVVEAMASGTVCILNDIPPFKELISDNKNGLIVNFNDYCSAKNVIVNILKLNIEKYNEISARNYANVKQYSWDFVTAKILDIYKNILTIN